MQGKAKQRAMSGMLAIALLLLLAAGCGDNAAPDDGRLSGAVTEKSGQTLTVVFVPEEGDYTTTYVTVPEATAEQIDIGSYVRYVSDDHSGGNPATATTEDIIVTGYHLRTWAGNDQRVDEVIVRDTVSGREASTDNWRLITQFTNLLEDVADKSEDSSEPAGPYTFVMRDEQGREILSFYMDQEGRLVSERGTMVPESGQAVSDKLDNWAQERLADNKD